jgi:short-subunit dehydrogenase
VYYCARAFLPLLIASGDGILVNVSSLNGLWASLGPGMPNNAYSTAKFAVRGFSEALIEDLRTNAPQVRVAVVLPGSVGTDILANTRRAHGMPGPEDMSAERTAEARDFLVRAKLVPPGAPPEEVRETIARLERAAKDRAQLSAAEAATIILDGVRSGAWRILVGKDAAFVDERVRSGPESAYDYAELFKDLPADVLQGVRDLPEEVKDLLPEWVKDQLPAAAPDESRGQGGDRG